MKKIGIVCCSNGQRKVKELQLNCLTDILDQIGIEPVYSEFLYERHGVQSGSGRQRAEALMEFYGDDSICGIFDISGGDIANEVLPYLDYDRIAKSDKLFFGYSDLTTVINAIYTKTGKKSGLYQLSNLVGEDGENQKKHFVSTFMKEREGLLNFKYHFLRGEKMEGIIVGGNIRCFLKSGRNRVFSGLGGKNSFIRSLWRRNAADDNLFFAACTIGSVSQGQWNSSWYLYGTGGSGIRKETGTDGIRVYRRTAGGKDL